MVSGRVTFPWGALGVVPGTSAHLSPGGWGRRRAERARATEHLTDPDQ